MGRGRPNNELIYANIKKSLFIIYNVRITEYYYDKAFRSVKNSLKKAVKDVIMNKNLTNAIINLQYQGQLPIDSELCVRLNNIFGQINHAIRENERRTNIAEKAPQVQTYWEDCDYDLDSYEWDTEGENDEEPLNKSGIAN